MGYPKTNLPISALIQKTFCDLYIRELPLRYSLFFFVASALLPCIATIEHCLGILFSPFPASFSEPSYWQSFSRFSTMRCEYRKTKKHLKSIHRDCQICCQYSLAKKKHPKVFAIALTSGVICGESVGDSLPWL